MAAQAHVSPSGKMASLRALRVTWVWPQEACRVQWLSSQGPMDMGGPGDSVITMTGRERKGQRRQMLVKP